MRRPCSPSLGLGNRFTRDRSAPPPARRAAAGLLWAACIGYAAPARGDNLVWDANFAIPPNGVFDVANNWNPNQVPVAGDTVTFDLPATYTVTFDSTEASTSANVEESRVTFSSNNTTLRTYNLTGGIAPLLQVREEGRLDIGYDDPAVPRPMFVNLGGFFNIGTSGLNASTISVSGAGSRFDATGGLIAHKIGQNGTTGLLTFREEAAGTIGGTLDVAVDNSFGTGGFLNVLLDADLTVANLRIGTTASGGTGIVNVHSVGTLTQSGASTLSLGASSGGTSRIDVDSNGVFSTGTGLITIASTGVLDVGSTTGIGTFNANGDVLVDGGTIAVDQSSFSAFRLASGKSLTASNAAQITLNGTTSLSGGSVFRVEGGSDVTMEGLSLATAGGAGNTATFTVDNAAGAAFPDTIVLQTGTLNIGHASTGAATLNLVNQGAFGSTGNVNILKTGTLNVTDSLFQADGDVSINGGTVHVVESSFDIIDSLGDGTTVTASNGALITFEDSSLDTRARSTPRARSASCPNRPRPRRCSPAASPACAFAAGAAVGTHTV